MNKSEYIINTLFEMNEQIWDLSYYRQQLFMKICSLNKEKFDIENYVQTTNKIIKLQKNYKELLKKIKNQQLTNRDPFSGFFLLYQQIIIYKNSTIFNFFVF
ncbi:MAG: hypothetical protein NOI47_000046 [Candidatus Phytoplasma pruni]|nr:hypothetical protein [Candidatus Phytoplasma pruni]